MEKNKSCINCRFYDGIVCMYECRFRAISDEEKVAKECSHFSEGKYIEEELDKTNYS